MPDSQIRNIEQTLNVGEDIKAENASWTFGQGTPKVFDKHISKSVPFYQDGHQLVLQISDFFVKKDSICYELGVSTGSLSRQLAARHAPSVKWFGIDIESSMIDEAKQILNKLEPKIQNLYLIIDDINLFPYESSDFIVAYYTIHFIQPRLRQNLINRIYETLNWGGAFLMFEKVRGPDARFQDLVTTLYTDFKLNQGYQPSEIIGKTRSLKGILEPFSTQGNLDMLYRAGFKDIMSIFKYICFEGFLCIK
jgi:tRNA (cmo5U34)-methyltransferase